MLKQQVYLLVTVLAVASSVSANFAVPPAGKCRGDIIGKLFNLTSAMKYSQWRFVYGSDSPSYAGVDSHCRDGLNVYSTGVTNTVDRFLMQDNSKVAYFFNAEFSLDFSLHETNVVGFPGYDVEQTFRIYVLDYVDADCAVLYYRCSDNGSEDVDTRYIAVPRALSLSAESEQQLFATDATYGFKGSLKKYNSTLAC